MMTNFTKQWLPLLLIITILNVGCDEPPMPEPQPEETIQRGSGSFVFDGPPFIEDKPINVYYYIPEGDIATMPLVFVFHGNARNARDYRDAWIANADQYGCIVVAPEFTERDFPGSTFYMEGNIRTGGLLNNEANWTFSYIDPLFRSMRTDLELTANNYYLWGHSAGAQFVHRYVLFMRNPRIKAAIASNAGWYTVPNLDIAFPYGLQNSPITAPNRLLDAFAQKLTIHAGTADIDPNSAGLRHTPEADAQGNNRYERANHFYTRSEQVSNNLNSTFNWQFVEVVGVAHEYEKMATDAGRLFFE